MKALALALFCLAPAAHAASLADVATDSLLKTASTFAQSIRKNEQCKLQTNAEEVVAILHRALRLQASPAQAAALFRRIEADTNFSSALRHPTTGREHLGWKIFIRRIDLSGGNGDARFTELKALLENTAPFVAGSEGFRTEKVVPFGSLTLGANGAAQVTVRSDDSDEVQTPAATWEFRLVKDAFERVNAVVNVRVGGQDWPLAMAASLGGKISLQPVKIENGRVESLPTAKALAQMSMGCGF